MRHLPREIFDLAMESLNKLDCKKHKRWSQRKHLNDKLVSKTQFRYDLNQIPYAYTVEVTNRFKGLDLRDRVPEELWTEVPYTVQEAVWSKPSPRIKKYLVTNDNRNMMTQNLWDSAKAALRGKFYIYVCIYSFIFNWRETAFKVVLVYAVQQQN